MAIKLSKEEKYGIVALVDLLKETSGDLTSVQRVTEIARRQNIPRRFLEQIFSKLRQANLVVGKRGPSGGYRLAKDAEDITLSSVIEALRPVSTVSKTKVTETVTGSIDSVVSTVWSGLEESFNNLLVGVTLNQLQTTADNNASVTKSQNISETTTVTEVEINTEKQ